MYSIHKKATVFAIALLMGLGTIQQAQGMKQEPTKKQRTQATKDLLEAAYWHNFDTIKKALTAGANINAQDKEHDGNTALLNVCCKYETHEERAKIIKFLLEKGADVNIQNDDGNSLLQRMCDKEDLELVQVSLDNGANVNVRLKSLCWTPLLTACRKNNTEIIKLLLTKNAPVNVQDMLGDTPLLLACYENNTEIIKLLIEKGSQVNVQATLGNTPLLKACRDNNTEVINALIAHGAEITPATTEWYGPRINQVPQDFLTLGSFYTNGPERSNLEEIKRLTRQYGYTRILADVAKLEMGRIAWQDLQKPEGKQDVELSFDN